MGLRMEWKTAARNAKTGPDSLEQSTTIYKQRVASVKQDLRVHHLVLKWFKVLCGYNVNFKHIINNKTIHIQLYCLYSSIFLVSQIRRSKMSC